MSRSRLNTACAASFFDFKNGRCDLVDKETVMRNEANRAVVVDEGILEDFFVDVQVVGWFRRAVGNYHVPETVCKALNEPIRH